jgi:site-specific DNA-methyltransferase (adenine-specific)
MKDISVLFSKASDNWETPKDIIEDLIATEGIAVDTACTTQNARLPVALAIDMGLNGLTIPWYRIPVLRNGGSAFCNPPHSQIIQWITKAVEESRKGVKVVMLIQANTDTDHWHDLVLPNAAEIKEVKHRIHFRGRIKVPKQPKDLPKDQIQYAIGVAPAPFASAIVIFDTSMPRVGGRPLRTEYIQPKERKK